jgi:hypothetical protein
MKQSGRGRPRFRARGLATRLRRPRVEGARPLRHVSCSESRPGGRLQGGVFYGWTEGPRCWLTMKHLRRFDAAREPPGARLLRPARRRHAACSRLQRCQISTRRGHTAAHCCAINTQAASPKAPAEHADGFDHARNCESRLAKHSGSDLRRQRSDTNRRTASPRRANA